MKIHLVPISIIVLSFSNLYSSFEISFPHPALENVPTISTNLEKILFPPEITAGRYRSMKPNNKPLPPDNKNTLQIFSTTATSRGPNPSVGSDDEIRSRLCPKTPTAEYRFDLDVQMCSKMSRQSHCGKNMIFYSLEDSKVYGHCDCNYGTHIPLVYHEKSKRCYFVYQQAYCKDDEWLELNKKAQPICSANKCYECGRRKFGQKPLASRDMAPEYVPLKGNGKCVKFNQTSEHCKKGQIVDFLLPQQFYASCRNDIIVLRHLSVTGTLKCSPGTYLSVTGQCQPTFDFDFDD